MKKFILLMIIGGAFVFTGVVEAKLLPRFTKTNKILVISPKLRRDRLALILTLSNLQKVNNITYTLMYQTNGKDEGVSGTIDSSAGPSATRELLFGTCSAGVCRYHPNITDMKLEIVSELPNGKQTLKRYRIKV